MRDMCVHPQAVLEKSRLDYVLGGWFRNGRVLIHIELHAQIILQAGQIYDTGLLHPTCCARYAALSAFMMGRNFWASGQGCESPYTCTACATVLYQVDTSKGSRTVTE